MLLAGCDWNSQLLQNPLIAIFLLPLALAIVLFYRAKSGRYILLLLTGWVIWCCVRSVFSLLREALSDNLTIPNKGFPTSSK